MEFRRKENDEIFKLKNAKACADQLQKSLLISFTSI